MQQHTSRSHSFVVRIWREGEDIPGWRGWVQHAGTGEATYVRDLNDLLAFIERRVGRLASPIPAPDMPGAGLK